MIRVLPFCVLLLTAGLSLAKGSEPSGLALQQVQAKDIEAPYAIVFASTMSVLQDAGYVIETASKESGLITANGQAKSGVSYRLFGGFGRQTKTPQVSATLEDNGATTRVRLNFVENAGNATMYGMHSEKGRSLTDPALYHDVFEKIEQAVFVKQAVRGQPAAATAKPN